jgi:hypothetical protein
MNIICVFRKCFEYLLKNSYRVLKASNHDAFFMFTNYETYNIIITHI